MSNPNVKPSDDAAIAAVINPHSNGAGTYTTGWVDMGQYEALQAIIATGTLGVNATVDAKLQQATSNAGAGVKDISGKAITQLTQAGTDKSNKQAVINLRSEELDVNGGFEFVRLSITVAVAASDILGLIFGHYARYAPPTPATSVDQTVA